MTLPRFQALKDYWDKVPPLNLSIAIFLGTYKSGTTQADKPKKDLLDDLVGD